MLRPPQPVHTYPHVVGGLVVERCVEDDLVGGHCCDVVWRELRHLVGVAVVELALWVLDV